ncbi:hypothetical protein B0T20DRAFT_359887 [Sordaria brevicollis]|uniref:Uncharacterized protein n=1 Tax=Sordaria brevicollis TaxID=83679 RepID=A0AAE0U9Q6_SORBR|nr:hypothetical protein B0T20DRAFT_359887 [Sordaria brevicollis]
MAEIVDPNAPPCDADGDYDMGYNDEDFDEFFKGLEEFNGAASIQAQPQASSSQAPDASPGNNIQQCANLARQMLSRSPTMAAGPPSPPPPPPQPASSEPYESAFDMEEAPPASVPVFQSGWQPIPPRPSPSFQLPHADNRYDGLPGPSHPPERVYLAPQGPPPFAPPVAPFVTVQDEDVVEVIDENGNIIIESGGPQRQRFLANTAALLRSSPVLAALIMPEIQNQAHQEHGMVQQTPPPPPPPMQNPMRSRAAFFVPPSPTDGRSLPSLVIPDVEDKVCKTFLLIIHGFISGVEKSFKSVQLFYDLLLFTHRYEMTLSLQSVAVPWLKRIYQENPLRHDEVAKQLWVVYELGHLKMIRYTIRNMVKTARITKDGQLLGYGAQEGEDEYTRWAPLVHLGLLRDITICRQRVMNRLLFEVEQVIERLTSSPPVLPPRDSSDDEQVLPVRAGAVRAGGHPRNQGPKNSKQPIEIPPDDAPRQMCVSRKPPGRVTHAVNCDASMLGALHRTLRQEGWATLDMTGSPSHLYRKIKKIGKTATEQVVITHSLKGHKACDPFGDDKWFKLEDIIMEEVKQIPFDIEELKKRGALMGFSVNDWK